MDRFLDVNLADYSNLKDPTVNIHLDEASISLAFGRFAALALQLAKVDSTVTFFSIRNVA